MKIALISSVFFGVPAPKYGGLERVVYDLWCGLVKRGHKVVCFSPDPTDMPEGGYHFSTGPAKDTLTDESWLDMEQDMWRKYDSRLDDFSVVHGHNWFGFEYASKARNKELNVCHTHHGHLGYWLDAERKHQWWAKPSPFKLNLIAISNHMKSLYETGYGAPGVPKIPAQTAYNGVDLSLYPYQKDKSDRYMFLGRIDPIKGVHTAIEAAEKAKVPIDIIGATSFVSNKQYVHEMKTKCSQSQYAEFIGEVSHEEKVRRLQNAKGVLVCSQFGEPFGLMTVEALSCGTPVFALPDGALPEVIEHGKSGFLCNTVDEFVENIGKVDTLSSVDCRKNAERFTLERMAARYEQLYETIIDGGLEW